MMIRVARFQAERQMLYFKKMLIWQF